MQVHQTPTLLMTRPCASSEQFAAGVSGADIVISPLMEIAATGATVPMDGIQGVIFTSQNAVAFAPKAALPAYCVGPRTGRAARAAGYRVRMVEPDANALVHALHADPPEGPLLHIHGVHVRGDVAARLTAAGIQTNDIATYDQNACSPDAAFHTALTRSPLIVPLFSPRSAVLFVEAAPTITNATHIIALSQAVADALPSSWRAQTHVVPTPNGKEMLRAMERFGISTNSP